MPQIQGKFGKSWDENMKTCSLFEDVFLLDGDVVTITPSP